MLDIKKTVIIFYGTYESPPGVSERYNVLFLVIFFTILACFGTKKLIFIGSYKNVKTFNSDIFDCI